MEFQTPYLRFAKNLDSGGGKIIVELAGYIPVNRRIKEMMEAGKRLIEHRTAEAYFHFKTGENPDLDFNDPTQEPGYDPADATQDAYAAKMRLNAQKAAAKARLAQKKESENKTLPPEKEVHKEKEASKEA